MIGKTILHYTIIEKIDEGGFVYKALDARLDRTVVLKFLPPHLASSAGDRQRLLQEARAASALDHPGVCAIHDIVDHDGQTFIVMEFVDGVTLHRLVGDGLTAPTAVEITIQAADALSYAHKKGVIHRDLKSENIMVTDDGRVMVMDFGLARLQGTSGLTRTSTTVGTLAYMAPEQIQGGVVDERSDIFSLGIVLFEALTGKLPFWGDHQAAQMYAIVNEEPRSLSSVRPDAPPELASIIVRSLQKNPGDRYQQMEEVVTDLRRFLRRRDRTSVYDAAPVPREAVSAPAPQAAVTSTAAGRRKPARLRTALIGAGLLAAAAGGYGIWNLFRESGPPPFENFRMSRIMARGIPVAAAVSPDGRYVAYASFEERQFSVWLQQRETQSEVQVVRPRASEITNVTFSPDGNFIYFRSEGPGGRGSGVLERTSLLGSPPTQILTDHRGRIALSADGKRMAFYRTFASEGADVLVIASSDGSGQRELIRRDTTDFFWEPSSPSWSPDNRFVACAAGTNAGGFMAGLLIADAESGESRIIGDMRWRGMEDIAWHPGGKYIMVSAQEKFNGEHQLWRVEYPSGEARRVTNDLNEYRGLSVTASGGAIVSRLGRAQHDLWSVSMLNSADRRQVLPGGEIGPTYIALLPRGDIMYGVSEGSRYSLWTVREDGTQNRRVFTDTSEVLDLDVSPDGTTIVLASLRSGTPRIWRMNADGRNLVELTTSEEYRPEITPDGRSVLFDSWGRGSLSVMKVSLAGGEPVRLTNLVTWGAASSPDGRRFACWFQPKQGGPTRLAIFPMAGGEPLAVFDVERGWSDEIRWSRDGRWLYYVTASQGVENVWRKPTAGGPARQVTGFADGYIADFDVTADDRQIFCTTGRVSREIVLLADDRRRQR